MISKLLIIRIEGRLGNYLSIIRSNQTLHFEVTLCIFPIFWIYKFTFHWIYRQIINEWFLNFRGVLNCFINYAAIDIQYIFSFSFTLYMVHNYEVWEMVTIKSGVYPSTKIMCSIQFPINMTHLECHLVVSFFVKVVNRGG